MSTPLPAALRAVSVRLGLQPHIERTAHETVDAAIAGAYGHRPREYRGLTPGQHRERLTTTAGPAFFAYTALHLSGEYGRAAAHLLHTLDAQAGGDAAQPDRSPEPARHQYRVGAPRRPHGGVFQNGPGLADTLIGLQAEITAAAEYLNSLEHEGADTATLAIAARLTGAGTISSRFATAIARHLVETEAQRLTEAPPSG
ncbi:hypothetical protein F4556_005100 [Kitasatospora gansuensis]|uniref:Uncharacterized protein n=1 Tax=Kitasatospora gansuensis TaxID=258050 RepID=A0A7W7SFK8_9ACTN|nr:hypothetical protein [Kitasatospora gansuensis]MBB4949565.1 hypothetical protein [Kitasatospora gansuensis]